MITYLVALYDQEPYVADCLESLVAQTDPRWRALVLDDCSTDGSARIVGEFGDERITMIRGQENVGYIAALRRLIAEADTEILAVLDPDDALHPAATELLLEAFRVNPEAGLVYSRAAMFDGSWDRYVAAGAGRAPTECGSALLDNNVHHIRAFRRSVYLETAGYSDEMLYAEDRDFVYKMEERAPLVFVDRPLYRYRILAGSQSNDARKRQIGARNHFRGQLGALRRRGLKGGPAFAHLLRFIELYLRITNVRLWRSLRLRRPASIAARWARRRWIDGPGEVAG